MHPKAAITLVSSERAANDPKQTFVTKIKLVALEQKI